MDEEKQSGGDRTQPEKVPVGQRFFDNIFLLLILSFLITFVLYNVWGLFETLGVPPVP